MMRETQSPIVDRKSDMYHAASHAGREVAAGWRVRRFMVCLSVELNVGKLSSNIQCTVQFSPLVIRGNDLDRFIKKGIRHG